jgi:hypothetical protein
MSSFAGDLLDGKSTKVRVSVTMQHLTDKLRLFCVKAGGIDSGERIRCMFLYGTPDYRINDASGETIGLVLNEVDAGRCFMVPDLCAKSLVGP